jgi:hypothetical protein
MPPERAVIMRAVSVLRNAPTAAAIAILAALGTLGFAQEGPKDNLGLPRNATALEGVPHVRIDVTQDNASRRDLNAAEAARSQLAIRIADGRFYWTSRGKRLLASTPSGEFTYLSSAEPGRYVRIRRLNDKLTYVEHVDTELGSVTYWGELHVVIGN